MFIFNLTFLKRQEERAKYLSGHMAYLDSYYEKGNFICSGAKDPKTGGIIVCRCKNKEEAERISHDDPFCQQGIASYEIIEFVPSKAADDFNIFLN